VKFFQKRSTASLIAAVVVILSVLFGAHRSLGDAVGSVSDTFYNGVYDTAGNYIRRSVYSQLEKRRDTAMSMISLADVYGESDAVAAARESLRQARATLAVNMDAGAGPKTLYGDNLALQRAADDLYAVLHGAISQASATEDLILLENHYATLGNAARLIEESGYNEAVRAFQHSVLSVFPANVLRAVTFVTPPELFE